MNQNQQKKKIWGGKMEETNPFLISPVDGLQSRKLKNK